MTEDQAMTFNMVVEIAEKFENLICALKLPIDPAIHVEQLRILLPELTKELWASLPENYWYSQLFEEYFPSEDQ